MPRAHLVRGAAPRVGRLGLLLFGVAVGACGSPPDAGSGGDDPPRLVALVPSLTETVIALGAADLLAARTDYDTHPKALGLPSVGGGLDPSVEGLVELGIDLVLMAEARDAPALENQLTNLGIETLAFRTETLADLYGSIDRLGRALDAPAAADSLSAAIRGELRDLQTRVAGRDSVDVLYVVWHDPPMTTGPGTFLDELIGIAGGRNVFHDASLEWPTVGFESIVERDPEVVIWPQGEFTMENLDVLQSTAGWRDVDAVREGRIVFVDGDLFNRPGPSVARAARGLARALHPGAF